MTNAGTGLNLRVQLVGREPFDVSAHLIDYHMFDIERARRKWPAPSEAPFTWMGCIAFFAARRTGQVEAGMKWEDWILACETVENLNEDEDEAEDLYAHSVESGQIDRPSQSTQASNSMLANPTQRVPGLV